jgi:hypothetical protein
MTAITDYQTTFNAYPGPFANDQIEQTQNATGGRGIGGGTGAQNGTYNGNQLEVPTGPSTYTAIATPGWNVTGAENLVLGLLGGLRMDFTNAVPLPVYDSTTVGLGPLSLGYYKNSNGQYQLANPKRTAPFIQSTSGSSNMLSSAGPFMDSSGNSALDCPIPVFVDRFPIHLPILYLRARVGAPNAVGFLNGTGQGANSTAWGLQTTQDPSIYPCQYDIGDVAAYTHSKIGYVGAEKTDSGTHGLTQVAPSGPEQTGASPSFLSTDVGPVLEPVKRLDPGSNGANGLAYLELPGSTPTTADANTVKPRMVDEYILISAGPDGIYGNGDDITNFGSVMP